MQQFVSTAVVVTSSECAWFRLLIGERLSLRRSELPARSSLSGGRFTRARFWFRGDQTSFDPDQSRLTFYG